MIEDSVFEALRTSRLGDTVSVILQFGTPPSALLAGLTTRGARLEAVGTHLQRRLAEVFPGGLPETVTLQNLEGVGQSILQGSPEALTTLLHSSGKLAAAGDIRVRANSVVTSTT